LVYPDSDVVVSSLDFDALVDGGAESCNTRLTVLAVGGAAAEVWIGLLLFSFSILSVSGDASVVSEIVPTSVSEVQ
jgi:hypothetical protein